jgi:hypothetical protein
MSVFMPVVVVVLMGFPIMLMVGGLSIQKLIQLFPFVRFVVSAACTHGGLLWNDRMCNFSP